VAESDGLENRCARLGTVGSNPTPSAKCVLFKPTLRWVFNRVWEAVRSLGDMEGFPSTLTRLPGIPFAQSVFR
jgi:hypothetical protein